MKKFTSIKLLLLLSLLLISLLITACNGNNSNDDDSQDKPVCEHAQSEWKIDKAASCSEEGEKHRECLECGESLESATIEKTAHTEQLVSGKSASCSEKGLTDGKKCSVCDAVIVKQEEIALLPHTEQVIKGKNPTCSEKGLTDGKKCSVCDTIIVKQEEIALLPHPEQVVTGTPATCTQTGLTDGKKCSVCGAPIVAQQTIPVLDHIESDWIIDQNAAVGVEGSKHTECTRCGTTIKTEKIPALTESHVHAPEQWVTVKDPTCAEEGSKNNICSCGYVMATESIPKTTAHTPKAVLGRAPTCSLEGLTDGVVCEICSEVIEAQTTIPTTPHTEQALLGRAPTCTETGLTDGKKCSVCDKVLVAQSIIAKAPHTEQAVLGTAATCTTPGTTDGVKCSVCSTSIVTQLPIPATGHSFKDGTCTACGIPEPYGIWIVDGQGNPVKDVIVKIMKGGEQVKMLAYKGEFLSVELELGTYEIVLDISALGEGYIVTGDQTLTPSKRTTDLTVLKSALESTTLFVGSPIGKDYNAYLLSAGAYQIPLAPNDYNFFVFTPDTAAIYTITYSDASNLTLSYHGGTFFVQGVDLSDSTDDISKYSNGLSLSVYASNVGASYVFAIKSTTEESCTINIKNAGDPGTRLEDEPWTPYLEDQSKVNEHLAIKGNGTYTAIDLTDLSVTAVFNSADGFYHLGSMDGPIIFLDLTSDSMFISSIWTICSNQRMGIYITDNSGNVVEKRSFNELYIQYGMPDNGDAQISEPIRVPLTQRLADSIKAFGDKNGWWKDGAETNIFTPVLLGAPYNSTYAWLLFCGYYTSSDVSSGNEQVNATVGTAVGNLCPDLLIDIAGSNQKYNVAENRGGITVLNFWFNTCPPCLGELPHFYEVANENKATVDIVAVHIELAGVDVSSFIQNDSGHPEWNDGTMTIGWDTDKQCENLFDLSLFPTTIILDKNGIITDKIVGALTKTELEAAIEKAMNN